ncbi:glycosyltransferase family 2 protein [Luteimonas sp. WGS1318]|uniref:glycosyltransferase family 2 protein n=1 Tax=Luteimonas sp. WGS1318 TaxID=3366815 RepID=UPI00372D0B55
MSTYDQPRWLALCLAGLSRQDYPNFEVLIADDGSADRTRRLIRAASRRSGFPIRHVWQEDRGFRKCRALNACIRVAAFDYVVFIDGDCVPREDFLSTHERLRRRNRFLSGGYYKLSASTSAQLTLDAVLSGACFEPGWPPERGPDRARRALKLTRSSTLAWLADTVSTARASWNGHNASAWREDLYRVNGFDERMGYGGEDRELGERLERLGVNGLRIRYRTPVFHLAHERSYIDSSHPVVNARIRAEGQRNQALRTEHGINLHQ